MERCVCSGEVCLFWRGVSVLERCVSSGEVCLFWRGVFVLADTVGIVNYST